MQGTEWEKSKVYLKYLKDKDVSHETDLDYSVEKLLEDLYPVKNWKNMKAGNTRFRVLLRCSNDQFHELHKRSCLICGVKAPVKARCPYCSQLLPVKVWKAHVEEDIKNHF
jgi:hypothetical protein